MLFCIKNKGEKNTAVSEIGTNIIILGNFWTKIISCCPPDVHIMHVTAPCKANQPPPMSAHQKISTNTTNVITMTLWPFGLIPSLSVTPKVPAVSAQRISSPPTPPTLQKHSCWRLAECYQANLFLLPPLYCNKTRKRHGSPSRLSLAFLNLALLSLAWLGSAYLSLVCLSLAWLS